MLEEPPDSSSRIYVPMSDAACGIALRLFRDQGGERCAVGFTRLDLLVELLGPDERYYRLTVRAVRELAAQRGVTRLVLDPALVAAPVRDLEPLAQPAAPVSAAPVPAAHTPAALVPVSVLATAADATAPVAHRAHRPLSAVRNAWENSQAAGILVVSAGAGAAALVLEALK